MTKLLSDIRTDVETGTSLSAAFRKYPIYFNSLYCNLVEAGEAATVHDRFVGYFIDLARREGPRFGEVGDAASVRERLLAELDNFRATADWLIEDGRLRQVVGLTRDLGLLLSQDAPVTARSWLEPAIEDEADATPQLRYDARWLLAWMAIVTGDVDTAMAVVAEWRGLLAEHDGIVENAWSFTPEMIIASYLYDAEAFATLCPRMREVAAAQGNAYANHMGNCYALLCMDADDPAFAIAVDLVMVEQRRRATPGGWRRPSPARRARWRVAPTPVPTSTACSPSTTSTQASSTPATSSARSSPRATPWPSPAAAPTRPPGWHWAAPASATRSGSACSSPGASSPSCWRPPSAAGWTRRPDFARTSSRPAR